jgi:ribosomal protein S14
MNKRLKKNINQRYAFKNNEIGRLVTKAVTNNLNLATNLRWKAQIKFGTLPSNSRITQIKNCCVLTGRSRSIYRLFKLSRIQLKQMATRGNLPGVSKISW